MSSRRFFDTHPAIFRIAKTSRPAARLAIFLRSISRQPASSQKRRVFRDRANVLLDDELKFEKWVHPDRAPANDRSVRFPREGSIECAKAPPRLRVAVACHLYHVNLIDEVLACIANIPTDFDLLVSTDTPVKKSKIEAALPSCSASHTVVRVFPNVGRDIASKLICFKDLLGKYDLILFIHGKRSSFSSKLGGWRQYLFDALCGSKDRVKSILAAFEDIPELGMIAPQHYPLLGCVGWRENLQISDDLSNRLLGERYAFNYLDFPSGSMFWCRPAALKPLLDLDLKIEDFPAERGQIDGTLAHAIERFFFVSCELAGFHWIKIAGASPQTPTTQASSEAASEVIDVRSTGELQQVLQRPGGRVIAKR